MMKGRIAIPIHNADGELVESYWSVFRLHELGWPVVSPMGRSVSLKQVGLLLRHGVTHVTVLFDGDDAGRTGTENTIPVLAKELLRPRASSA
ncbi:MAG: toprim domain-containing protein [Pseudomonadota bacterium]